MKAIRHSKEKDLTAYCGLYCGDCIRYQCRASDLAEELLQDMERVRFSEYADVKRTQIEAFEDVDSFISFLKALSAIKCETPCRLGGDGCGGACEIVACVKQKSLKGCWECDAFEKCSRLEFLKPFHGDGAIHNLRRIKRHGLENWARHRDKCYPWM